MTNPGNHRSKITVELGDRSYDIIVGENLLAEAGEFIAPHLSQPETVIVTDANVEIHCLPALLKSLEKSAIKFRVISLPAGEKTKSFSHLQSVTDDLLAHGIDRKSTLIALGGGVIGDLTGFAAAVTMRGIPFIQIPTTVLSQVDSSVGGKTGINTQHGKNLIGAFHQPSLVLADVDVLDTLPRRELLAGYAETVKYGLINNLAFFDWCEQHGHQFLDGDRADRTYAVTTSCQAKANVVADDEREAGNRALLNLGHTFGHALEAETGYGSKLLHGEAVAIGTIMAFDMSVGMGLCPVGDAKRVRNHFESVGLPVNLNGLATLEWSPERLLGHMMHDKKTEAGKLTLILARGIGKSFVTQDIDQNVLHQVLEEAIISATP